MKAFGALATALALCLLCIGFLYKHNQRLAGEVAALQETVDTMAREQSLAHDMADRAIKERAKQYDANTQMLLETQRVLQDSGDFCRQLLPDSVRRILPASPGPADDAAAGAVAGD